MEEEKAGVILGHPHLQTLDTNPSAVRLQHRGGEGVGPKRARVRRLWDNQLQMFLKYFFSVKQSSTAEACWAHKIFLFI